MSAEFEARARALEAELHDLAAADADLERDAEVAERTRIERAHASLADRVRGATGRLDVLTRGGSRVGGEVAEVGADWMLLAEPSSAGAEHVVPFAAVVTVRGLGRASALPASAVALRSVASVLRSWCRDRAQVRLVLADGASMVGRADAAYADHLDVVGLDGDPVSVPYTALAIITRSG